jgi:hypothetical protein
MYPHSHPALARALAHERASELIEAGSSVASAGRGNRDHRRRSTAIRTRITAAAVAVAVAAVAQTVPAHAKTQVGDTRPTTGIVCQPRQLADGWAIQYDATGAAMKFVRLGGKRVRLALNYCLRYEAGRPVAWVMPPYIHRR